MLGLRTAFAPGSAPLLPGLPRPVRLCHPILMKTAINPSAQEFPHFATSLHSFATLVFSCSICPT